MATIRSAAKRRRSLDKPRSGVIGQPKVKRSGTLGISYQLRSALKERHRLPARKRAYAIVPFCSSFRAERFWTPTQGSAALHPGLRSLTASR